MKRLVSILLLITMTYASCSLSAGLAESVDESELIGTWQFVGGGEIMGYGFRLNADGTGEYLDTDAIGMGTPKHLQSTGNAFVWHVDDDVFSLTVSGTTHTYPVARYDRHIHFAEGDGGGFYQKYDEEAIRTEIEERMRRGEMTEFDALAMDYIEDKMEPALAEKLQLRSVDVVVDWYSEEKSVTVSAWSLDLDHDLTVRFTESDTMVSIGTSESTWFTNSGIRINPTADRYYQAARAALDQVTEIRAEQQILTGDVTPSGRELLPGEVEIMAGIGVCVGDEVEDVTQIPVSWYENYLRAPNAGTYENALSLIQSELALASQQQQTLFSMPGLTGYVGQFPKGKTYEVYRGPGREYGQSANGKASVSTNDTIWIYGFRGDWMLISYGISGGHFGTGFPSALDLL